MRLFWSTSTLMVLLPLAGCLLFVLRRHYNHPEFTQREFREFSEFMIVVFASFVVPICALAFGTASIGGDREDRTLVFLLVRPIPACADPAGQVQRPRCRWCWAWWSAATGSIAGWRARWGRWPFALYLPAVVYMTLAYVCLFHLFAVAFRHATIIALVYAAVHGNAARQPAGHRQARGRELLRPLDPVRRRRARGRTACPRAFEPLSLEVASWALAGIAVGGLVLAVHRLLAPRIPRSDVSARRRIDVAVPDILTPRRRPRARGAPAPPGPRCTRATRIASAYQASSDSASLRNEPKHIRPTSRMSHQGSSSRQRSSSVARRR